MSRNSVLPEITPSNPNEESVKAWRELLTVTPHSVRLVVAEVVREGATTLTETFYARLLANPRSMAYLDQEQVKKRLKAALKQWMVELFATLEAKQIEPSIQRQIEIGVVHARVRLPIDLIPAGIRLLKRNIRRRIDFTELDAGERLLAQIYISDLLHLVDGLMNQAFFRDSQEVARNDEAYRQLAHKRGTTFERTRQRAALSEWAEQLFISAWTQGATPVRLRDAEFGIWLHHKGAAMFEGADELGAIHDAIEAMDTQLLPRIVQVRDDQNRRDALIGSIKQLLDLIRFRLNDLFEGTLSQDEGLDPETQLPDRRYLPSILTREMQAHQASNRLFCLLLIEVQFPDLQGPAHTGSRNRLLQASAQAVSDSMRTTDHLFRYDENRLLLLAVECDRGKANRMATGIMEKLVAVINTGNVHGLWTPVTPVVSIGIAEYDRHPDYQYLIQRTENALAEATLARRNRIAIA